MSGGSNCLFPLIRERYWQSAVWHETPPAEGPPKSSQDTMGTGLSPGSQVVKHNLKLLDIQSLPRDDGPPSESQLKRQKFQFFSKECSEVADGLYVSGELVAKDRELLGRNRITHVVNCVGALYPEYFKPDLTYKTLFLQDSPSEDILCVLYDTFEFIHAAHHQGGRVLVHCSQGVSRSATLAIAYLMWRLDQTYEETYQKMREARGVTSPNIGFTCQLLQWQKRRKHPPTHLRMYRIAPHTQEDPLYLVPKTVAPPKGQTHPSYSALDPRGVFLLHLPERLYIWQGKQSLDPCLHAAQAAAALLRKYEGAPPAVHVLQGEEPADLVAALQLRTCSTGGSLSVDPSMASISMDLVPDGSRASGDLELMPESSQTSFCAPTCRGTRPAHLPLPWCLDGTTSARDSPRPSLGNIPDSLVSTTSVSSQIMGQPNLPGLLPDAAGAMTDVAPVVVVENEDYTADFDMFYRAHLRGGGEVKPGKLTPRLAALDDSARPESPGSSEGRGRKYRRSESERSMMGMRSRQLSLKRWEPIEEGGDSAANLSTS